MNAPNQDWRKTTRCKTCGKVWADHEIKTSRLDTGEAVKYYACEGMEAPVAAAKPPPAPVTQTGLKTRYRSDKVSAGFLNTRPVLVLQVYAPWKDGDGNGKEGVSCWRDATVQDLTMGRH